MKTSTPHNYSFTLADYLLNKAMNVTVCAKLEMSNIAKSSFSLPDLTQHSLNIYWWSASGTWETKHFGSIILWALSANTFVIINDYIVLINAYIIGALWSPLMKMR